MGSLLRYVWLFLANSNQSRSAFIRTPNSYFISQFLLYLFVGIWQSFVFVYLCPRVDDNAADFSRSGGGGGAGARGVRAYLLVPLRTSAWKATGDVVLCFFRSLFFLRAGRYATKDGLISLQRIVQ